MSAFRILKSQRGDILVIAMVLFAISVISSLTMLNYSRQMQTGSKRPRIKSMMTALEAKVRSELLKPTTYTNCTGATGRTSCNFDPLKITSLSRVMGDVPCPLEKPLCGIEVAVQSFDKALVIGADTFTRAVVRVRYEGTDMAMDDIDIVMDVPADILQSTGIYQCPASAPKFDGLGADGRINCSALPPRVAGNLFVNEINVNNLTIDADPLPSPVDCGTTHYVNHVGWGAGGQVLNHTCTPRADPFTVFGFTPTVGPSPRIVYTLNPL
ncbi:MAG: type IV pilus modification PilV family protein [Pseudobdellovibrionaceae bacterium]